MMKRAIMLIAAMMTIRTRIKIIVNMMMIMKCYCYYNCY